MLKKRNSIVSGRLKPFTDHFTDGLESNDAEPEFAITRVGVAHVPLEFFLIMHISSIERQVVAPPKELNGCPCPMM